MSKLVSTLQKICLANATLFAIVFPLFKWRWDDWKAPLCGSNPVPSHRR